MEQKWRDDAALEKRLDPIKKGLHTLKEVETNLAGMLDEAMYIDGTIDVSSYYNWGFRDAQTGFFSFAIRDATGSGYVYMERGDASNDLRAQILAAKGPIRGIFKIVIPSATFDHNQSEVLGFLYEVAPPLLQKSK